MCEKPLITELRKALNKLDQTTEKIEKLADHLGYKFFDAGGCGIQIHDRRNCESK